MNRPTCFFRAVLGAATLLVLNGCSVHQQADVASYRAVSDPPGPLPSLAPGEPLSLQHALRLTAAHNEQLAAQGERWVQALAERQRLAAALRPTVDFFGRSTLRENTGNAGVAQTDVGISGQYRLLTGLSDLRSVTAADARAASQRWLILDLRESLLVQTARAYYETLRAQRLAEVLENTQRAQSERLADAKARNEAGFTRSLDVAQIEAQLSRTRSQLIDARRQLGDARSLVAFLTNAPALASEFTDGFEPGLPPPSLDFALCLADANRQDVLATRDEADAARQLVDAALGEFAPSLAINLDYFLLRAPDDVPALSSLVEARLPLLSAGRLQAQARASWSVFRERVLDFHARRREARRDVESAHLRLQAALELSEELRSQVRVATQALELAEASYQAGLGTNLERIIAQDQLLAAELEEVSARFETKTAYLELLRASGILSAHILGSPLPDAAPRPAPSSPFLDRPPPIGGADADALSPWEAPA